MEGNFQGDLADVVRASGGCGMVRDVVSFPLELPLNMVEMSGTSGDEPGLFGDPFSSIGDPFHGNFITDDTTTSVQLPPQFRISATTTDHHHHHHSINSGDQMRITQRDLHGPSASASASSSSSGGFMNPTPSSPKAAPASFIDTGRPVMSSPPTNPIPKRRKSQAKKVVCIPAPTAVNSRQGGGEVVPSDLWAWRKYGQKPIKGSPYPRGYYRCSSSKGCSARKQVERSRTDPNMLVITYTSEHNHPWPTQRNALAGSSRISATPASTTSSPPPPPACPHPTKKPSVKEETDGDQPNISNEESIAKGANNDTRHVEAEDNGVGVVPNQLTMNDLVIDYERSYRPVMQDDQGAAADGGLRGDDQDFFADLRELETDPLNDLLFSSRGGSDKSMLDVDDPFGCLFDWPSNSNTTTATYINNTDPKDTS